MRFRFALALLLGLVLGVGSPSEAAQTDEYQVGPGDLLEVSVFGQPDLSGRFPVAQDGFLEFPLVGRLAVAGRLPREVQADLTKRLADGYLKAPQVSVSVAEFRSRRVFVTGEVARPGPIALTGSLSLLEALAAAGSVAPTAGTEVVLVRRDQASGPAQGPLLPDQSGAAATERFALADLQAGRLTKNPALKEGDTIFVPKAEQIYVLGQVLTPGAHTYRPDLTVFQAIALAGGMTPMASSGRIRIIRMIDGEKKDVKVKLDDPVKPGDTVMVPSRWF